DFPFLWVQLPRFIHNAPKSNWAEIQEAQLRTLALRKTGMAVTLDVGNLNDIHPTNKLDPGKRLALAARHVAYGEQIVYSGPIIRQATRDGHSVRLWFDHTASGLKATGGNLE